MRKIYVDTGQSTEKRKYNEVIIESAFVQLYTSAYQVIYKLKFQCSLYLLIWIINEMTEYNQIILNKGNRSEFIYSLRSLGRKYSDDAVRSAIRDMVDAEILLSISDQGKRESTYMVNPKHFWKTRSQGNRSDAVEAFINLTKIKENEGNTIRSES